MKKFLLILLALGIGTYSFGQKVVTSAQNVSNKNLLNQAYPYIAAPNDLSVSTGPTLPSNETVRSRDFGDELVIGQTKFDLQSNRGMGRQLTRLSNGKIAATWIFSASSASSNADRGTGYNLYTPVSGWAPYPVGTPITSMARLESAKVGFSYWGALNNDASEIVIAHNGTNLNKETRSVLGTGTWTGASVSALPMLWPRLAVGGTNNNTIHVIGSIAPIGTKVSGIYDPLIYSRSTNGGVNWTTAGNIQGEDATLFKSFSNTAEDYAIDANGSTVAIVVGGFHNSAVLFKSTDNGTNWTHKMIWNFPNAPLNPDSTAIPDTTTCFDGAFSVIVDNSNIVHVWGGVTRVLEPTTPSTNLSYFPGIGGIIYWRDNMATITGDLKLNTTNYCWPYNSFIDRNGDGKFVIHGGWMGTAGSDEMWSNVGATSRPSASIDASNNLYVAFNAIADDIGSTYLIRGTDTIPYRHIFGLKSTNNGVGWENVIELTPFDEGTDYMFPSVARNTTDSLRMIYQRDDIPGISLLPTVNNQHTLNYTNDIVYLATSADMFDKVIPKVEAPNSFSLYPNPSKEYSNLTFSIKKAGSVNISIINLMGQQVYSSKVNVVAGQNHKQINTSELATGLYLVKIETEGKVYTQKLIKD
ncbi:MAG: T9SS type A sorting domain-containing protein [Bacteroidales bacterium]